jgi:SNF2 family DNA or RNA helicase
VIVPFKGIIQLLEPQLQALGYTTGVLNGDVSVGKRRDIIQRFKTDAAPHILLCHPKVMAHGLNLTEADMIVFYAPIYSYDEYAQVVERISRAGQTRKMTVVRMGAHRLEWKIYGKLDDRGVTQKTILDLYAEVTTREAA